MYSKVFSAGLMGVDAYSIEVEVDCCGGMGQINVVGLPDAAVKESQERVRAAIRACEFLMPPGKKWTVNLAPADTKKEGPSLDLPIAVGILSATNLIPASRLPQVWMAGELGLDGSVRGISGILPIAMACRANGFPAIIVPEANADEALLVEGLKVFPVSHLQQVVTLLSRATWPTPATSNSLQKFQHSLRVKDFDLDYCEVKGQNSAKEALMVAAAGRHNILMVGPPGSGKSMLAQRIVSILPPLDFEEALEITKLYSVAGLFKDKGGIISRRPFRSPHHSASLFGLIGGGATPRPGEISLSHQGVLFLDEMAEFSRHHLDALRQPLEAGTVTISRAQNTFTFPASFLLVGACNPCPCGYRGDLHKHCSCSPYQAERYWSRLSGPLLDRIDLHIDVSRLELVDLTSSGGKQTSEQMYLQVMRALEQQRARSPGGHVLYNSQLNQFQIRKYCAINQKSRDVLASAVTQMGLSARAYDRVLRIARTIADLAGSEEVLPDHIVQAVRYRVLKVVQVA